VSERRCAECGKSVDENQNGEQPVNQPGPSPEVPAKKNNNNNTKFIIAGIIAGVLIIIAAAFFVTKDLRAYHSAQKQFDAGEYQEAYNQFKALGDYRDSQVQKELANKGIKYNEAMRYKDKEEYTKALSRLADLDFEDSEQQSIEIKYLLAKQLMDAGDTGGAVTYLEGLDYQDSEELLVECKYLTGKYYYEKDETDTALKYLEGLDYQDSVQMVEDIKNPYTLSKFVKRYNIIATTLEATGEVTINTLSEEMFSESKVDLDSTARISFNNSGDQEGFRKNITDVSYVVSNRKSFDEEVVSGELLAVIGAMVQDESLGDLNSILTELIEGSGTISNNGVKYSINSTSSEVTLTVIVEK